MKLNLKARMRHKEFCVAALALILVLANQIAGVFGHDITIYNEQITAISETVFTLLGLLGVFVDPTTRGLSDSKTAMGYTKPKKE